MGSRVLLISANRCATPDAVFPLGLSHLNAALRRAGHVTRWVDCLADAQPPAQIVAEFQPDYVGISIRNIDDVLIRKQETYFGRVGDLCVAVRKSKPCPVILGGSGFSIFPEQLLVLTGADYGIQGEGEAGLVALIQALAEGKDLRQVPGLVFRRDGQIVANDPQPATLPGVLEAQDRPPHLVSHYLKNSGMLNLQTQRGCAHSCCYCTYPVIEGRTHRRRRPDAVAEEMAELEAQGAKYAFLVDSVFNSSPRHVVETCEAIIRRGLQLHWGCFARPQGLTPELMSLMARAGLSHLEFGSDSFCDSVLAAYDKRLTFDDILQSSELAHQHHVDYCHFLICGGPGETAATLQTTFENSLRLEGAVVMACVGMRIYPGTALFQQALREGRITPATSLLDPTYYLAPGLTSDGVFATLREFSRQSPNWIAGDPTPGYTRLVERLRARGVTGPLWSYFSMVQRVWQPMAAETNA